MDTLGISFEHIGINRLRDANIRGRFQGHENVDPLQLVHVCLYGGMISVFLVFFDCANNIRIPNIHVCLFRGMISVFLVFLIADDVF